MKISLSWLTDVSRQKALSVNLSRVTAQSTQHTLLLSLSIHKCQPHVYWQGGAFSFFPNPATPNHPLFIWQTSHPWKSCLTFLKPHMASPPPQVSEGCVTVRPKKSWQFTLFQVFFLWKHPCWQGMSQLMAFQPVKCDTPSNFHDSLNKKIAACLLIQTKQHSSHPRLPPFHFPLPIVPFPHWEFNTHLNQSAPD